MFNDYFANQYRRPSGIVGRWIGQRMVQQHRPENLWTVALLDLQPSDNILELGFGGGFAVQEAGKRLITGKVAGIDFSKAMLRTAKKRNAASVRAGRVDLRYGDAAQLPFPESTFDKAYSIHSIYFWREPLMCLREIARVLKPGGTVIFTFLPTDRWKNATEVEPIATETFKPYSGDSLKTLLAFAGFIHLRIETDNNTEHLSNYSVVGQKPSISVNHPAN